MNIEDKSKILYDRNWDGIRPFRHCKNKIGIDSWTYHTNKAILLDLEDLKVNVNIYKPI